MHRIATILAIAAAACAGHAQTLERIDDDIHGWPGLNPDAVVHAQTTWDPDGAGPAAPMLVVGGDIQEAGHVAVQNLAAFDGQAWRAISEDGPDRAVYAMAVHDGDLVIGGNFGLVGGRPMSRLARFDGQEWHAMTTVPFDGYIADLDTTADGRLIAVGTFESIDGVAANHIAAWDGTSWSPLGDGLFRGGSTLLIDGNTIYATGGETRDSRPAIDRWDGTAWTSLTHNLSGYRAYTVALWLGQLVIGGDFRTSPFEAANIAWLDGTAWRPLPSQPNPNGPVTGLIVMDDDLVATGEFSEIGGQALRRMARFDSLRWRPMRFALASSAYSLHLHQGKLYAAGTFLNMGDLDAFKVAAWDGLAWSPVGRGIGRSVNAIEQFQGKLMLGGAFTAAGGLAADRVVAWDGASFSTLGLGLDGPVEHMAVLDDSLVVAGPFTRAGFALADDVAAWDGSAWRALGDGPGDAPTAIAVFQGQLYAAGTTFIGRPSSQGIARWNGGSWEPVGEGFRASYIYDLGVMGDRLVAFGYYGDDPYGAMWDGSTWTTIPFEPRDPLPLSATEFDHPDLGPVLLVVRPSPWGQYLWMFDGESWEPLFNEFLFRAFLPDANRVLMSFQAADAYISSWDGTALTTLVEEFPPYGFGPRAMSIYEGSLVAGGGVGAAGGRAWARWRLDACRVDLDGDGALTIFDFLEFQNHFEDRDPAADFDGDGEFTIFDFLAFQNAFDLGCD